jgi:predicted deacetylase
MTRLLVVAIHDVAPRTLDACRAIAARLDATGVAPLALLVVPAFHGDPPFGCGSETARWLRARQARGDEVVLHGYRHLADRTPRPLGDRFRARLLSAGEGEFLALGEAEASARLSAGLDALAAAGLGRPEGFVAPAWLLGEPSRLAASRLGFAYTTTRRRIDDLARDLRYRAPAVSLSCRTPLRAALSRIVAPCLWRAAARAPALRAALHPIDLRAPAALEAALGLILAEARRRPTVTYGGAVGRLRELADQRDSGVSSGSDGGRSASSAETGAPGIA